MRWGLVVALMSSKQRASPIAKHARFINTSPKKIKDAQCSGDVFVVSGKAATYSSGLSLRTHDLRAQPQVLS